MRILVALLVSTLLSVAAFADDIDDAKKAFATMVEYQKTDDARSPDLFAKNCLVTVVFQDTPDRRTMIIPPEAFIAQLKEQIALQKGSKETYEDVKFVPEGRGIRLTANLRSQPVNRTSPFSALYRRDDDGVLRIHEFNIPVYGVK